MNESLKTNDQVNRDAASVVPTPSLATTAAPVQRMVMRFLRFAINCFCVNESVISSDLKVVNMILAKEPQFDYLQERKSNNGVQRTPTRRHARCLVASLPAPVAPTVRGR
jgi:hypothetical protein